jgi:hypothetical protein
MDTLGMCCNPAAPSELGRSPRQIQEQQLATGKTTKRTFTGRKSKVDQVAHLVGKVSDRELAHQIGVTPENVRTWRKRRGIEASWKTDAVAAEAPAAAPKAKPKRKKKRKSKGASRRKSKLDPWFSQLGAVPDREVAEQAGVTPENVRAYRKRHGIPSTWRIETPDAETSAQATVAKPAAKPAAKPVVRRARKEVAKPATADTSKPRRRSAATATRGWAFRVTADVDGTEREYVTFGADVVEAAQVARDRLAATKSSAHIKKIEVVGVAL